MPVETKVRVFRSPAEIEEIRSTWESWPGHRDSHIDFYLNVVASNPLTIGPHVIAVYADGRLDAILIGRIDLTPMVLKLGYWRVPSPRIRLLSFVIGAQRGNPSPEVSELLFREALNSLRRREADAIRLEFVQVGSVLYRLAKRLPGVLGRGQGVDLGPHWKMALPPTYEEVLRTFSGDLRWQLKRKAKKIQSAFPALSVRCFDKVGELDQMIGDVEAVAMKSYQRGLGVGFHNDEDTRQRLSFQMTGGHYLGYILYLEGRPSAFWLGSFYDRVFFSDYLGFDPAFSAHSPGLFLQTKVLENLVARQTTSIDFGPGDARYKSQFGTACQEEICLYVFPSTLRGMTLNLLQTVTAVGNRAAKAAVRVVGVLPRLKKAMRDKRTATPKSGTATTDRPPHGASTKVAERPMAQRKPQS
jgi:hypothetical protein